MPFVQAKCPECGGVLAVDDSKKAAVCQFCSEAFIVQDAINNYNTYNITNNNTTHNYGDGAVVNIYEDKSKDFVIEAGVLKEYHGADVDVVIPNSVQTISATCFQGMPIKSITISSNISEKNIMDVWFLCGYKNLKELYITEDCNDYVSENGIIYNSDKTRIIWLPENDEKETFTIIDSVCNGLSSWAKFNLRCYSPIYYKGLNINEIPCDNKEIQLELTDMKIGFEVKHSYVDYKCSFCGIYDYKNAEKEFVKIKGSNPYIEANIEINFYDGGKLATLKIDDATYIDEFRIDNVDDLIKEKCKKVETLVLLDLNVKKSLVLASSIAIAYCRVFNLFPFANKWIVKENTRFEMAFTTGHHSLWDLDKWDIMYVEEELLCENWELEDKIAKIQQNFDEKKKVRQWVKNGLCKHCGGTFKGLLKLKCSKCGLSKDY